ncbi:pheophytinase [Guillardia theta CCMP2712]|uniref:Pheophytinase n=1 Tax=Guillardia theta (strain CCMP2712) TaxID=905079 RepID=L1IE24_GUITC|nr:pheophytinase [Guillardia theta CCMP2712]EKX34080.1 pheophytinase [Guillardia theta CCMP2712]|eukprot:XP_005821060.1 pheophytinase [Guillardia theta CCMP2712]
MKQTSFSLLLLLLHLYVTCGFINRPLSRPSYLKSQNGCATNKLYPTKLISSPRNARLREWRNGWKIHYKKYGKGFGVGEFHYERNVEELSKDFEVWDKARVGPRKTLPQEVIDFIEQIVQRPCYVAGNSLGGYLAVMTASSRPELTKGLLLLNATPIWGVGIQKVLPWSGGYPVPEWVRPITFTWWDGIRSSSTITSLLSFVYANKERIGPKLIEDIIEPTEHPAAASAFASILCSRGSLKTFDQMLGKIKEDKVPVSKSKSMQDEGRRERRGTSGNRRRRMKVQK